MTCIVVRSARVGFAILLGTILAAAASGDAAAKVRKAHLHARAHLHAEAYLHARSFGSESRGWESAWNQEPVSQQPARLGPMRYYGGPKSPMWRGPAEN